MVRAPEIGLWSIRGNNNINKSFGSRNSNSSSCSSSVSNNGKKIERKKKKKKLRLFDINSALFGGCKCSVLNAVEVVPSKIVIVKEEEKEEEEKEKDGKQKRKQAVSRNRTFEWLKQLSLEGTADGA